MKISGSNISIVIIIGLLLLVGIVAADDSEYCAPPPTNITTVVDHNGDWWNITITSDLCYTCIETGGGYGDVDCIPCGEVIASFTSNVTCGNTPFWVQFNDTSTGTNITSWYWDFGDGRNSTDKNPLLNYTVAGFYDVNHSATGSLGTNWSNHTGYMAVKVPGDYCAAPGGTTGARYVVQGQSGFLLYVLFGITAVFLAIYGLLDLRNRFYANIGALFISSLIAWFLSTTIGNGTMRYCVVADQIAGTSTTVFLKDAGLGWLILIPAVAAMIMVAYLIYDAYEEGQRNKREEEW
jgi:PKD repeat protein